ncbi:YpuI family protein [Cytobacillus sp. IB215665]|uniref:YpuI family protein n=1 Tax=Cytobacillus sp. IB215665 TaxID=3097357 RepID=UPI002A0DE729|nr:YpuI family protein [Cytobacillus sp. IB215665]MDX8364786.1 YpuI family protein [Cytobacillus sp. IB215665]
MGNSIVQTQTVEVEEFLSKTVNTLTTYLNGITIHTLLQETPENQVYFEDILSEIRRLVVYCEEGLEACRIVLSNVPFRKAAAEKTLYKIYHQCIEEFFSPKKDLWYEDSRSAYTGNNSIRFREVPPSSIKQLLASLEKGFQTIREELEYYETDYHTKILQSK